jgi:ketosteroid isomerase-like protein
VRNPEAERFVRRAWAAFEEEGIGGVLALAAPDAEWRPHSANNRVFRSTAEYRAGFTEMSEAGERVEAIGNGMWSDENVVVVRGRMRIRKGAIVEDTRMYWLFEVRGEELTRMASSPDLAGLLRYAGREDPGLANEAFIGLHRDAGLGGGPG